jgi:hypothetical protein
VPEIAEREPKVFSVGCSRVGWLFRRLVVRGRAAQGWFSPVDSFTPYWWRLGLRKWSAEVKEVIEVGGVDFVMLDNMDYATMREAVNLIDGRFGTEASGGITEETLEDVAQCGVDFISMGALTHSVKSMDISLKAF